MTGYKTAYRIKMEDYRIGLFYERGIIDLKTVMHRRDITNTFFKTLSLLSPARLCPAEHSNQ